jgi:hypothetical protein
MQNDKQFEMFKKLVPYLRGALWWARNDLIKHRQPEFNQNDEHVGHPLLSVSKKEVASRFGVVPMLVGTTGGSMSVGRKLKCIMVVGMTKKDPEHRTYFGSIVQPGMYEVQDLMDGVKSVSTEFRLKDREKNTNEYECYRESWHHVRIMVPNIDKQKVSPDEMIALDKWCTVHGFN